jgi:hypothetical protein
MNHRMKNSIRIKISFLFYISLFIIACSDNTIKMESIADSGMGYWIKKSDYEYEYRISNINKEKIYKDEMKNTEKIRNSKILLGITYIMDIDDEFLSMGNSNFGIDLESKDTLVQGKYKDYLIVFEAYKNIYFPKTISVKDK